MKATLLNRPSAFIPVVMSATALAIVLGYAVMFGVARQADEETAAHLWQMLMVGQIPIVAFFVIKWVPREPKLGLLIVGLQIAAAVAALFPVWWFNW